MFCTAETIIERLHETSCTPFKIPLDIHSCLFHAVTGIDAEDMISSRAVQLLSFASRQ